MPRHSLFLAAVAALLSDFSSAVAAFALANAIPREKLALPLFFFHGIGDNATIGRGFDTNLSADGRLFTSLTFCEGMCSVQALNNQLPLAIEQIRSIVANDSRYDNGYVFVAHSQGAALARGVIEEMDDHKVRVLVSVAGAVNGVFNGPQPTDAVATSVFATYLGPLLIPSSVFDFSQYTQDDYHGKIQRDFADLSATSEAQQQISVVNLGRTPYFDQWVKTNPYFPRLNNLNLCHASDTACEADKKRRRANFLKLKEAHFFASSGDDVLSPWQMSHLGSYSEVTSAEEVETKFESLEVLDAKQTREYASDSYGLQTLDKRGGLFFHTLDSVGHYCWMHDYTAAGQSVECKFRALYNDHLYPVFQTPAFFSARSQC